MPVWTPHQINQADKEGWNIFEASGSCANHDGRRTYQLQRVDPQEPGDVPVFDGDIQAQKHVAQKASEGSALHREALMFLSSESPAEYADVIASVPGA